ncbi:hypothetical protein [Helicobacter sp. 13S00477-4]|uniref:hypothetical protein n=1 Tax=Helicobacter sp. 13S00477-4 TaxID=1905759 RepID=UPI000BA59F15|nr:hypothetical protein [Helicobacter sp. 13S00477-4]PAF52633.1 hypothetical protein BKH44_00125 [Helicobacter sp. 13S00477-4]
MKTSHDIISNIKNQTHFKKLQVFNELEKLKLFLPFEMRKEILYIVQKNNKLLFAFKHPSFVNEFNHYNYKDIKESLKTHKSLFSNIHPDIEIQAFLPRAILNSYNQENVNNLNIEYYHEHSKGSFENIACRSSLRDIFESIREVILKNQ